MNSVRRENFAIRKPEFFRQRAGRNEIPSYPPRSHRSSVGWIGNPAVRLRSSTKVDRSVGSLAVGRIANPSHRAHPVIPARCPSFGALPDIPARFPTFGALPVIPAQAGIQCLRTTPATLILWFKRA
ncbi:MAG: hypothetical protein WD066_11330 [Planctomycetaceae bacterium]